METYVNARNTFSFFSPSLAFFTFFEAVFASLHSIYILHLYILITIILLLLLLCCPNVQTANKKEESATKI